ncbi:MAG: F0F1 ATP synthase subunit B [Hyphomicrobiaceae bacterium]
MFVVLAADGPLLANPEFWVALAFVIFVGFMVYLKVPGMIGAALDKRAERIRNELDEARRLREDAKQLLTDYQRKAAKAEDEAREIITRAETEAQLLAEETRRALAEAFERRMRIADEKIARAEAQAVADIRAAAIEQSALIAEGYFRATGSGSDGQLIDDAIRAVGRKFN